MKKANKSKTFFLLQDDLKWAAYVNNSTKTIFGFHLFVLEIS